MVFCKVCSMYVLCVKTGSAPKVTNFPFSIDLYREYLNNHLVWNRNAHVFHIWQVASSRGSLQSLFEFCTWSQNCPWPGYHQFNMGCLYTESITNLQMKQINTRLSYLLCGPPQSFSKYALESKVTTTWGSPVLLQYGKPLKIYLFEIVQPIAFLFSM